MKGAYTRPQKSRTESMRHVMMRRVASGKHPMQKDKALKFLCPPDIKWKPSLPEWVHGHDLKRVCLERLFELKFKGESPPIGCEKTGLTPMQKHEKHLRDILVDIDLAEEHLQTHFEPFSFEVSTLEEQRQSKDAETLGKQMQSDVETLQKLTSTDACKEQAFGRLTTDACNKQTYVDQETLLLTFVDGCVKEAPGCMVPRIHVHEWEADGRLSKDQVERFVRGVFGVPEYGLLSLTVTRPSLDGDWHVHFTGTNLPSADKFRVQAMAWLPTGEKVTDTEIVLPLPGISQKTTVTKDEKRYTLWSAEPGPGRFNERNKEASIYWDLPLYGYVVAIRL